ANPPALAGDTTALTAPALAASDSGESVTLSTKGYHHNVLFFDLSHSGTQRSFSLKILNLNFIWYSLYLEYLDANGQPIATTNRNSLLEPLRQPDPTFPGIDVETDTLKFWDVISSPPTVFGLPIPFPYEFTLSLPDGASQVRINLIGPGAHGKVDYGPSLV